MKTACLVVMLLPFGAQGCGGAGLPGASRDSGAPDSPAPGAEAGGGDGSSSSCDAMGQPVCVANCTDEFVLLESALCQGGQWTCPLGYVNSTTCPANACAVSPDACCDPVTGELTINPCPSKGGIRPSCPSSTYPSDPYFCIPPALGVADCSGLNGRACSGEVYQCTSFASVGANCLCLTFTDSDAGAGRWHCSIYIGP